MRTTLTIDDELFRALKRRAADLGLPMKEIVERALRAGIQALGRPSRRRALPVPTFHMGPARYDLEKALRLSDELENEELVRKVSLRK